MRFIPEKNQSSALTAGLPGADDSLGKTCTLDLSRDVLKGFGLDVPSNLDCEDKLEYLTAVLGYGDRVMCTGETWWSPVSISDQTWGGPALSVAMDVDRISRRGPRAPGIAARPNA
jgi:hypothetical protein